MMRWTRGVFTAAAATLIVGGAVLHAADIDRVIAAAESRRKGAEASMREIAAKSDAQLEQARAAYTQAATKQNAWLDLVVRAVEGDASAAPDVTAASQAATAALMNWIVVGGRALSLPALSDSETAGLSKSFTRDLTAIATETWTTHRESDPQKRSKAVASLNARLRWKSAEEITTAD
jgi:hypothetical protein